MKIYRMKLTTPVGLSDSRLVRFIRQLNLPYYACCVHAECYLAVGAVSRHGRFAYYGTIRYIQIPSFANMYVRNLTRTVLQVIYFDEFHSRWARLEIYPAGMAISGFRYRYIGEI